MRKLSELTDQELFVIQKTGIDADNFLKLNEFYTKHLKPALEVERENAKNDGDWIPGRATDLETVALYNAFNSGKRHGLNAPETACNRIISRGIDVGKEIERRRKHEKQKTG